MRATWLALLLLAACGGGAREELPAPQLPQRAGVDPTVAARAEGIEFRAVGEGIVVDIFRTERIRVTRAGRREELVFPKPEPVLPRWNGSIYETAASGHTLRIEIHNNAACQSALRATSRVVITLDGEEIDACGASF